MQFLQTLEHRVTVRIGFAAPSLDFGGDVSSLCARGLGPRERNSMNAGVDLGAAQE
jgi:hypothetical protein